MSPARTAGVLVVEHAPHEGPYAIAAPLEAAGLPVRVCRTWAGDRVPDTLADVVALVVMGGSMAAYEDSPGFPTRDGELALLRAALEAEIPVLGVCLGAQLLASAAGGTARAGVGAQIGWGEIRTSPAAPADPLFADAPEKIRVLHWHADTMDLPSGATLLASCDRYAVQAFRIGGSAWGLQFHLEVDRTAVEAFAAAFPDEAATAPGLVEALHEWARVTAPGGVLLLFHPSGRAERAARHGRAPDPGDPLAEENLLPALHAAGWAPTCHEDAPHHFLTLAERAG